MTAAFSAEFRTSNEKLSTIRYTLNNSVHKINGVQTGAAKQAWIYMKTLQIVTFKNLKSFSKLHLGELNMHGCLQNSTSRGLCEKPPKTSTVPPTFHWTALDWIIIHRVSLFTPYVLVYTAKKSIIIWFGLHSIVFGHEQQGKHNYRLILKLALWHILWQTPCLFTCAG